MAKRIPISHAGFCDLVAVALRASIADLQGSRRVFGSDSLKTFCDIRISQFQDALAYLRKIRSLENVKD